ncbi:MAG: hypothetical protein SGPRY_011831, partial [Prymnesium sp.]
MLTWGRFNEMSLLLMEKDKQLQHTTMQMNMLASEVTSMRTFIRSQAQEQENTRRQLEAALMKSVRPTRVSSTPQERPDLSDESRCFNAASYNLSRMAKLKEEVDVATKELL